jgi:hypothetical protein
MSRDPEQDRTPNKFLSPFFGISEPEEQTPDAAASGQADAEPTPEEYETTLIAESVKGRRFQPTPSGTTMSSSSS